VRVKFWGVCGSIPSPCPSSDIKTKIRNALIKATPANIENEETIDSFLGALPHSEVGTYKGNTSCVQVEPDGGDVLVFDAGSGIRRMSGDLLRGPCGKGMGEINLFLSHMHWDHLQGFPFFVPIFIPGNKINIFGVIPDLAEKFKLQMSAPYFPVLFEYLPATFNFVELAEGQEVTLNGGTVIKTEKLYHPQDSHAFSVEQNGKKVVYMTDSEFNLNNMQLIQNAVEFSKDADVLIFDCQYTFSDTISKMTWGHSSVFTGIDIATSANVKRMYLFHHEPGYEDAKVDQVIEEGIRYRNATGNKDLVICGSYDGLEYEF
jgi:phosphoribosyl 1,2-cyclic phosphodiesterase